MSRTAAYHFFTTIWLEVHRRLAKLRTVGERDRHGQAWTEHEVAISETAV